MLLITTHPEARAGSEEDWMFWDDYANDSSTPSRNPDNPWRFVSSAFNQWLTLPPDGVVSVPMTTRPPRGVSLALDGPHPATGTVSFRFGIPERARVELVLFDVHGRRVDRLVSGEFDAGHHTARWTPRGMKGAPAGVHFARLTAGPQTVTLRPVVLQ